MQHLISRVSLSKWFDEQCGRIYTLKYGSVT